MNANYLTIEDIKSACESGKFDYREALSALRERQTLGNWNIDRLAQAAFDRQLSAYRQHVERLRELLEKAKCENKRYQTECIRAGAPDNLTEALLPGNLPRLLDFVSSGVVGIYGVPSASVVRELLDADDIPSKEKVLDQRAGQVIADCKAALGHKVDEQKFPETQFIYKAIEAFEQGHEEAAQALLTLTLDSLISKLIPNKNQKKRMTRKGEDSQSPIDMDIQHLAEVLAWLPVWNAHAEFWVHRGDPVPVFYARHATVHAVSFIQYTRANCLCALLLVTGILLFDATTSKDWGSVLGRVWG